MQFLETPGNLDRPAVVAEVSSDLAHDGRNREGDEVRPGLHVEANRGVDQPDPRDLNKVVTRFAATLEPPRDVIGQRQAPLNDLVPVPLEFR
ncbi:Uncharacterised protein [Mycobacterium tuberculosis]|uniref:Uncharacterized protein n=1 Tax=Mycobacterium tuberculosis TaxID=1773 RepID=A0A655JNS2_MYCTX|nr:Uncharacterised protein [Mycobacterium tuberculosis]CFS55581.1 Uncharacterised protein [Mycobacterium tuberculosis]CKM09900.1 Uncharacterised protein [Mycobacterium tuberculosis]CKO16280.1 Uncharacterised protein [Mycobacterium tuberculosis]CKR52449.1 Uncharacterised protein [Mycobacterium tuberculosis]